MRPTIDWFKETINDPRRLTGVIVAVWVACSMAYAAIERKGPIESLWWGIVTGSTVGYGDSYPATTAGRGVGAVLIISMLILVPIAIGHVIAGFVKNAHELSNREQIAQAVAIAEVHHRLERLEALLFGSLTEIHGADWVKSRLALFEVSDEADPDVGDRLVEIFTEGQDARLLDGLIDD